jgi:hypothetical protein
MHWAIIALSETIRAQATIIGYANAITLISIGVAGRGAGGGDAALGPRRRRRRGLIAQPDDALIVLARRRPR